MTNQPVVPASNDERNNEQDRKDEQLKKRSVRTVLTPLPQGEVFPLPFFLNSYYRLNRPMGRIISKMMNTAK